MSKIVFSNTQHGKIEGVYTASSDNKDVKIALLLQSFDPDEKINVLEKEMLQKVFNLLIYLGYNTFSITLNSDNAYDSINNLLHVSDSLDWLQSKSSMAGDCIVVANAYATWSLMQLVMRRPEIQKFILLSPLFHFDNCNFMHPCPIPGLIVYDEQDKRVKFEELQDVVKELQEMTSVNIDLEILRNTDASFLDRVAELLRLLYRYLSKKKKNEFR